jgi:hypothetical protein
LVKTAGGISASKAVRESRSGKAAGKAAFFHAGAIKAVLEVLALCDQV